ncbi:MAG: hypothetical protein H6616_03725 [Ignavibacteria bacterium]|nr:hypothetical protein [Ignavibacteria bacterium]
MLSTLSSLVKVVLIPTLLLSTFIYSDPLFSQTDIPELHWEWKFAEPTPHTMKGIHFFNEQVGIMAGMSGTILRTTDRGTSWETLRSGARWDFIDIVPHGDNRAWLPTGDTNILMTTDQGATWQSPEDLREKAIIQIAFLDEVNGYAISYTDTVYRTLDGGVTWLETGRILPSYLYPYSTCFIDTLTWVAGRENGDIHRTSDGGLTWEKINREKVESKLIAGIVATEDGLLYAAGDGIHFLQSTDSGVTWISLSTFNFSSNHRKLSLFEGTIAVYGNGLPLISVDSGRTWNHMDINDPNYIVAEGLTAVKGRLWMTGKFGQLLTSDDDGVSWQPRFPSNRPEPTGLCFFDRNNGLMSSIYQPTYRSSMFRTTDGGQTWEVDDRSSIWYSIYGLERVEEQAWMIGYGNTIYHSSDSGKTWEIQSSGTITPQEFIAISFADRLHGYAITKKGLLMRTKNGGDFWELRELYKFDTEFTDVSASSPDSVWISTTEGYALLSTDGGSTFSQVTIFTNTNARPLNAIQFVDPMVGWVIPNQYGIMRTTDGGQSWHQLYPRITYFYSMHFLDRNHGIATVPTEVWVTDDGGETWQRNADQLGKLYTTLSYINEYGLWAGTSSGGLLHAERSLLSVREAPAPTSLQSYPNPTSGTMTVSGLPPQQMNYTLILTATTGEEILQQDVWSEGGKVTISVDNLPSAVYAVRLSEKGSAQVFHSQFVVVK